MRISLLNHDERNIVRHNNGLANYLNQLVKGREATPHSWLFERESSQTTLNRWLKFLKPLERGNETERKIYAFDLKQVEKFGPQGGVPPVKEAMKTESFQEQYVKSSVTARIVLRPLDRILGLSQLKYWTFEEIYNSMKKRGTLSTNSGWPLFKRRRLAYSKDRAYAESGASYNFPAIILFRSYNGKLRVVWMYPQSQNLIEYTATNPLQDAIKESSRYTTPWLGFEHVKKRFTELWNLHPFAFGGDTTAMDAHMQLPQLNCVGHMCATLFADPTNMLQSLRHVSNIDLVVGPEQIIRDQQHGIASGSGWTQLSETIFQIGMFDKYIRDHSLPLTVDDGMGIGDDYVWFFDSQPKSEDITSLWEANGLPSKVEKQSNNANDCTFLQRLFIKGFFSRDDSKVLGGIYPTIRALNSLLNPENFHSPKVWNSDMFCTRVYEILENTVDHPLFEEFCRFVVKGQKDLLPFAKMAESKQNAAQISARLIPGFNPTYNQEKMDKPLSEFSSIKYVRSL